MNSNLQFQRFLLELHDINPDTELLEGVISAYSAIFEADWGKLIATLPASADYTSADKATANMRGRYGNLIDFNEEKRHKGMVGDSFVGAIGTKKADEQFKQATTPYEVTEKSLNSLSSSLQLIVEQLFKLSEYLDESLNPTKLKDIILDIQNIDSSGGYDLLKAKYPSYADEEKLASKLQSMLNSIYNGLNNDTMDIEDANRLMNQMSSNLNTLAKVAVSRKDETLAKMAKGHHAYNPAIASDVADDEGFIDPTYRDNEAMYTYGAELTDMIKKSPVAKIGNAFNRDAVEAFSNLLSKNGIDSVKIKDIIKKLQIAQNAIKNEMVTYHKKNSAPIISNAMKALHKIDNDMYSNTMNVPDEKRFKWPYVGSGVQQTFWKDITAYVTEGKASPKFEELLAQMDKLSTPNKQFDKKAWINNVYTDIYKWTKGDTGKKIFNELKANAISKASDDVSKLAYNVMGYDDVAFSKFMAR